MNADFNNLLKILNVVWLNQIFKQALNFDLKNYSRISLEFKNYVKYMQFLLLSLTSVLLIIHHPISNKGKQQSILCGLLFTPGATTSLLYVE